jgi:hypothetical protein
MRHRLFAGFAACLLALTATSCAELTEILPPSGPPLTSATDPGIKAAGQSSAEVDREKQAQAILNKAIEARNPKAVDEATKLRPQDPSYLFAQYGLQSVVDRDPDPALLQRAIGLVFAQHPELAYGDAIQLAYIYFLDALQTTNRYAKGSPEWTTLRDGYCSILAGYRELLGSERADLFYSNDGCPQTRPVR